MNCAEKRFYQKKPLSPGYRCVVFLAVLFLSIIITSSIIFLF